MKEITTQTKITVPFYDLDPMNIVWHGNYVKYLEVARCDFFKHLNYTYEDMRNDGYAFPIAKMEMKYIESAHFGQEIIVECKLVETDPAVIFKYKIFDSESMRKIFTAKSMQIGVDVNTGETILSVPENFKQRIESYNE